MAIYITGDVMRCYADGTPNQIGNIDWLYNQIRVPIERVTGISPQKLVLPSDHVYSEDRWLAQWDVNHPSWHLPLVSDDDITIGFEMPPNFVHQFKKHGRRFINIVWWPIRYLDDLVLGIQQNVCITPPPPNLRRSSMQLPTTWRPQINEDTYYMCANSIVTKVRQFALPLKFPPNTAIIVGQVEKDSSTIRGGVPLDLMMFEQELRNIISGHSETYFKSHPMQRSEKTIEFMRGLGVIRIEKNMYRILCEEGCSTVCGISSSVLHEAKYFGKYSVFFANDNLFDGFAPVSPAEFTSLVFWATILQYIIPTKLPEYPEWIIEVPNKMRQICGWWSYDYVYNLGTTSAKE